MHHSKANDTVVVDNTNIASGEHFLLCYTQHSVSCTCPPAIVRQYKYTATIYSYGMYRCISLNTAIFPKGIMIVYVKMATAWLV